MEIKEREKEGEEYIAKYCTRKAAKKMSQISRERQKEMEREREEGRRKEKGEK